MFPVGRCVVVDVQEDLGSAQAGQDIERRIEHGAPEPLSSGGRWQLLGVVPGRGA